jgi:hypothetical protein
MKSHAEKPIRAAKAAGRKKSGQKLVDAWISYHADPREAKARNSLALEVDAAIGRGYPRLRGEWLQGSEEDVKSRAVSLLVDSYLMGNRKLQRATERGDLRRIADQLLRSLRGAMATAKRETLKPIRRHRKLLAEVARASARANLSVRHPANYRSLRDLPLAAQRELLIDLVAQGVESSAIAGETGRLATKVIEEDMTPTAAGRSLGMSRRKAHAQMQRLRGYLNRNLGHTEFPMM